MCCVCACENGKTNLCCLSQWEIALPPLGLCRAPGSSRGDQKSQDVAVPWQWPWVGAGALCAQLNSEHSHSQLVCQSKSCSAFCCQGMSTPVPGAAPRGPCSLSGHTELLHSCRTQSCQLSSSLALHGQPSHKASSDLFPWAEVFPFHRVISLPL